MDSTTRGMISGMLVTAAFGVVRYLVPLSGWWVLLSFGLALISVQQYVYGSIDEEMLRKKDKNKND